MYLLMAADYNHWIIVASENVIHHHPGYTSVAVFKGMYAEMAVVESRGEKTPFGHQL